MGDILLIMAISAIPVIFKKLQEVADFDLKGKMSELKSKHQKKYSRTSINEDNMHYHLLNNNIEIKEENVEIREVDLSQELDLPHEVENTDIVKIESSLNNLKELEIDEKSKLYEKNEFRESKNIRKAFVMSEILGKPKSLLR